MLLQEPLFLKNKDWYFDDNDNEYFVKYGFCCHKLTDKAPKEAVESYLDFCEALFSYDLGYVPEFVYEDIANTWQGSSDLHNKIKLKKDVL